jgi:hypothetical protein
LKELGNNATIGGLVHRGEFNLVERHRRRTSRRHREDMVVVEPMEDPHIASAHATNEGANPNAIGHAHLAAKWYPAIDAMLSPACHAG